MKHTKGKWNWDGDPTNYDSENEAPWLISDSLEQIITGEIRMNNIHDVTLVACAPELLEELQKLRAFVCSCRITDETNELAESSRLVIRKATGEN